MTSSHPEDIAANTAFLHRVAAGLLASPDLAEDAVQETLWIQHRRAPGSTGLRGWLVGVLRNVARNVRRSERRRQDHERRAAPRASTSAEAVRERESIRRELLDAVLGLPDALREVVLLRYDEGLPPRAVARRTGVPVSTVHDRLRRAIDLLRERLGVRPGDRAPGERRALLGLLLPPAFGGGTTLVGGGLLVGKKLAVGLVALLLVGGVLGFALAPWEGRRPAELARETAALEAGPPRESVPTLRGALPSPVAQVSKHARRVFGHVVDRSSGEPVAGARVYAFSYEGLALLAEARTLADGGFELAESEGRTGAFHLVVRHPDFAPHVERTLTALPKGRVVRLHPPSWIVGRIATADGRPPEATTRLRAVSRARKSLGSDQIHLDLDQVLPTGLRAEADVALAEDGAFRLGPLSEGAYSVLCLVEERPPLEVGGARSWESGSGVVVARGATVDLGTVLLPPARRVVVRVLDRGTREPVLGAFFEGVQEMDRRETRTSLAAEPTGTPGDYALLGWQDRTALEADRIQVTAPGYGPTMAAWLADHEEGPPVALLSRAAHVEGEVRDAAGSLLPGHAVLARRPVDGVVLAAASTDAGGTFRLEALPSWVELELVAVERSADSVLAVAPLTLWPGETRRVVLGGADATAVAGTVRDVGGPVVGALVSLDDPSGRRLQVPTGADGRYSFVGLEPGRHLLTVWIGASSTSHDRAVEVVARETTDASLSLVRRLRGRVALRTLRGEPVESWEFEHLAILARPRPEDVGGSVLRGPVAPDGTFSLSLPEGTGWSLVAEGPQVLTLEPRLVEGPAPEDASGVTIDATLDPGDGAIRLRIRDVATGTPIPEARYQSRHGDRTTTGTLGAEATIAHEGALLGRHDFVVSAPEHVPVSVSLELTPAVRSVARDLFLPRADAVRVTGLSTPSPAGAAGLRVGDLLLRHGPRRVENVLALLAAIQATGPRESVRLEGLRDGAPFAIDVPGGRLGISAENARSDER